MAEWGGLRRGTMLSASSSVLEKAIPPALALMPDTSVPPCMPLLPFKLLPRCWSPEGVSPSKCLCGPCKRNCLGLQQFFPPAQSPLVFTASSHGDLSSWHGNPRLERLVWGWDPSLLRYPSQFLSATHWCGTEKVREKAGLGGRSGSKPGMSCRCLLLPWFEV